MVLTDEQWAALEPLLEACRPKGKTPPRDLRRTIEAIVWRHENGAKWRAVPAGLGPWGRAAPPLLPPSRPRGGGRPPGEGGGGGGAGGPALHPLVQARGVAAAAGSGAGARGRARHGVPRRDQHQGAPQGRGGAQKGGTSRERDRREALGRSRGGFGTKACVIADGRGRAVAFSLAPGQAHELPLAPGLLDRLPRVPLWVVGDRGYSSDAFRELVWSKGARPAIPTRSNEVDLTPGSGGFANEPGHPRRTGWRRSETGGDSRRSSRRKRSSGCSMTARGCPRQRPSWG